MQDDKNIFIMIRMILQECSIQDIVIKKLVPQKSQDFWPEGQIQDGRWRHLEKLTFEPEHLESCMKTLFRVSRPQGFRFWHQFDVMTSF